MKKNLLLALSMACLQLYAESFELKLWPEGVPESNEMTQAEELNNGRYRNVSDPTMTVFPAKNEHNQGAVLILCPGGGYVHQAIDHEGFQFTNWLNENGITAVVLKYRLPNGHHQIAVKDALQCIRIVRSKATEWHIDPNKIGIAGFSAGGHLASTAGTHFDEGNKQANDSLARISSRPDFMILFYPVISMQDGVTHKGSKQHLLGEQPDQALVDFYSNEKQVKANTPPTLLLLSDDDKTVIPQNSIGFYQALKQNKVPAAMYIFPEGGHGWGYRESFRYHHKFKHLIIDWLNKQGFIK